jgi:DNA-binding CsgD family transcriptional regulator
LTLRVVRASMKAVLLGRSRECGQLDRLLEAVAAGEGRALVLRGEAGVGKTALLDCAVERASGWQVVRAAGVQSEMELAFAGLHQACAPMLDRLDLLPGPQQDALRTAFGLSLGEPPDRFLVALAVLSLLSEVAGEQPLICVVDDAQWLDQASAQTLAFVARRLSIESVALLFGVREDEQSVGEDFAGLPELVVEGLPHDDARALLDTVIRGRLDDGVRSRIIAETRGNPLALLELPRGLSPGELVGGFGLGDALPLPARIEESFRQRWLKLQPDTRRLLVVAAAEPLGEPLLVWRAAAQLGIGTEAAAPAAAAGLLEFGAHVRFRHPLVRSAVYRATSPEERRQAHGALAKATDPEFDADRRAWHRAQATPGPDEDVASELERSAGRAQARGGWAAAAAFLEHAAALTLDPARRAQRALTAAQAKHQAGASPAALELLATAEAGPLDELQRARAGLLRAQIVALSRGGSEAPPLLLEAATRLETLDAALARETYLELLAAALFADPLASSGGLVEAAEAARAGPSSPESPRAPDLLLDGLAALITEGYAAATPTLKRALSAFRADDSSREEQLRWLWVASLVAMDLWDDEAWHALSTRFVQLARDAGAVAVLPVALISLSGILMFRGELAAAASVIEEAEAVSVAIGNYLGRYGALGLATLQGREDDAAELIEIAERDVVERGEAIALGLIHWSHACLHNAAGRYDEALLAAENAPEYPTAVLYARWVLTEHVEAAARSGRPERGTAALERLSGTTVGSGSDWARGIEARSRALLSDDDDAEPLYRQAVDNLSRTSVRWELARAHLVYGEWLRSERRRADARVQLNIAYELFTKMGMESFAQRAARELLAAGDAARPRIVETRDDLTAQEAQIARLARDGLSNPEIGARLFISPRTVEYHLHKVFGKLEISSRRELQRVLSGDGQSVSRAPLG